MIFSRNQQTTADYPIGTRRARLSRRGRVVHLIAPSVEKDACKPLVSLEQKSRSTDRGDRRTCSFPSLHVARDVGLERFWVQSALLWHWPDCITSIVAAARDEMFAFYSPSA